MATALMAIATDTPLPSLDRLAAVPVGPGEFANSDEAPRNDPIAAAMACAPPPIMIDFTVRGR